MSNKKFIVQITMTVCASKTINAACIEDAFSEARRIVDCEVDGIVKASRSWSIEYVADAKTTGVLE